DGSQRRGTAGSDATADTGASPQTARFSSPATLPPMRGAMRSRAVMVQHSAFSGLGSHVTRSSPPAPRRACRRAAAGVRLGRAGEAEGRAAGVADWIGDYIETTRSSYAAAIKYEQLSRLSDAELLRRGLTRQNLASELRTVLSGAERSD